MMKNKALGILKSTLPVLVSGVLLALFVSAPVLLEGAVLLIFCTLMCAGCLYFLLKDQSAPILSPVSALVALVLTIVLHVVLLSLKAEHSYELLAGMEYWLVACIQGIYFGILLLVDLIVGLLSVILKKKRGEDRKGSERLLLKTVFVALGSAGLFIALAAFLGKDGLSVEGTFFLAAVLSLMTVWLALLISRNARTWREIALPCGVLAAVGAVCTVLLALLFKGADTTLSLFLYSALSFGVLALSLPLSVLTKRMQHRR